MKTLLTIALLGTIPMSYAEQLSAPSFQMEVEDGWEHSVGPKARANENLGDVISISHPNGSGVLKVQFYSTPESVSKEVLRNLTNVDTAKSLSWQNWGAHSGYQYNYQEKDAFYRQWWLATESGIIFVVYSSNADSTDIETAEINNIVYSITANDS